MCPPDPLKRLADPRSSASSMTRLGTHRGLLLSSPRRTHRERYSTCLGNWSPCVHVCGDCDALTAEYGRRLNHNCHSPPRLANRGQRRLVQCDSGGTKEGCREERSEER